MLMAQQWAGFLRWDKERCGGKTNKQDLGGTRFLCVIFFLIPQFKAQQFICFFLGGGVQSVWYLSASLKFQFACHLAKELHFCWLGLVWSWCRSTGRSMTPLVFGRQFWPQGLVCTGSMSSLFLSEHPCKLLKSGLCTPGPHPCTGLRLHQCLFHYCPSHWA